MFRYLKVIAIIVLFIEIALFILIGKLIGVFLTILLVILSMIIGITLFKRQNANTMLEMQKAMQTGQMPNLNFMAHSMNSIAAILLIIPGFFTDFIAILCFIPRFRPIFLGWFTNVKFEKQSKSSPKNDHVIEGECSKDDEQS